MYLLNLQNYPDFCFPPEINCVESLADCRSSGVLLSLLLNLRNGPGVSDRVNKHWSSKEVAANWSRVIHGGMICVWEQTDSPCMFLLTLVQILGQIKDATWLLQTECSSDQDIFSFLLLLPSNLLLYFHLSLPLSRKYRPFHFLLSPFSSCPTSIFLSPPNRSIAILFS